ncbi:dehydrogenase [Mariniphaga sediminis]|uniref:Dehydrogenase n=1 Tax=Mariniphaga sediminis TaxID=1628158 RepID=A0A399D2K5_9BACT|nr:dehydrogenase [Mariniphaga sediminis]RIH66104.1 dehydrogenase [Mariniphaga sediminis]
MIIRSKAPLRIGFAGGGTDVSPYSDIYGGAILNATINMYAYATIIPRNDNKIIIRAADKKEKVEYESAEELPVNGELDLAKAVYNRIVKRFGTGKLAFEIVTYVDAPPGSGLGSSSTLVTAITGAFVEWLNLPLGEYDIANLAYIAERVDLQYAGGKQDQYAATFGGFNFMEFYDNDKVIVNPLRIRNNILNELAFNLVLYYTGTSRLSSKIIEKQQSSIKNKKQTSIEAMHQTKEMAVVMKEAILKGELDRIGSIMMEAWNYKKRMASGISNKQLDTIYDAAIKAGATGGKISGAGGGGFMFFYCPDNTRYNVISELKKSGGVIQPIQFTKSGLNSWSI